MLTAIELTRELAQYHGSETLYRHSINPHVVYTEGARALAVNAGAYWLLDEIALANLSRKMVREEPLQIWKLRREDGDSAVLSCDGNDGRGGDARLFTKLIPWTDFPLSEVKLYCQHDGARHCIMLPSEY
jgi:hypothetical protein